MICNFSYEQKIKDLRICHTKITVKMFYFLAGKSSVLLLFLFKKVMIHSRFVLGDKGRISQKVAIQIVLRYKFKIVPESRNNITIML